MTPATPVLAMRIIAGLQNSGKRLSNQVVRAMYATSRSSCVGQFPSAISYRRPHSSLVLICFTRPVRMPFRDE